MNGENNVRYKMAGWSNYGDAPLPKFHVHQVVEDAGEGVAGERGEEDEGDDGVAEVVVLFKLRNKLEMESHHSPGEFFIHMGSMPSVKSALSREKK